MPGNRHEWTRCGGSPCVTGDQRWNGRGKHDTGAEYSARDHHDERRSRLIRVLVLRRRATGISLRLRDATLVAGIVGLSLVHRAGFTLGAACHPRLWICDPSGTVRDVPGKQAEAQENDRKPADDTH